MILDADGRPYSRDRSRIVTPRSAQRGLITPALLGVVSRRRGSAAVPIFDGYTTGLWCGSSFARKTVTGYGGNARTTRRSAGGSSAFGFSGDDVDLAGEAAYVGGGAGSYGFVSTSNDHSGGGNNFVEGTTTRQPRSVLDGAPETFGYSYNATDQRLNSVNTCGTGRRAITFHLRANEFFATTGVWFELGLVNNTNGVRLFGTAGSLQVGIFQNTATIGVVYEYSNLFGQNDSGQACSFVFNMDEAVNGDKVKVYKNGVFVTPASTVANNTITADFANETYYLGARSNYTFPASIRVRHWGIHHAAIAAADIAVIHARMLAQ